MNTFARIVFLALIALATFSTFAETLSGKVVGITDGDTLTLLVDRTQHKIRLAEIDTPERGQDWGTRARQALADKVFQEDVNVKSWTLTATTVWLERSGSVIETSIESWSVKAMRGFIGSTWMMSLCWKTKLQLRKSNSGCGASPIQ